MQIVCAGHAHSRPRDIVKGVGGRVFLGKHIARVEKNKKNKLELKLQRVAFILTSISDSGSVLKNYVNYIHRLRFNFDPPW